ncbi:MAG: hypothetical protein JWR07_5436 [Nevskia sp.]|nr:hypothetical protein [Nevskia sp.]
MFKQISLALPGALLLSIAGCATYRQTDPPRTATEELLVSTAVDHAVDQIKLPLPADSKVFVDTQYYDTDGVVLPKYTIAAVHDQLLRQGAHLMSDRKDADVVVELRSGAQSIDYSTFLIGIPSFPLPIPFAGTLTFPEIAFFKITRQIGVSKLALTGFTQKEGGLVASSGPEYGQSQRKTVMALFVSWTDSNLLPPEKHDEAASK